MPEDRVYFCRESVMVSNERKGEEKKAWTECWRDLTRRGMETPARVRFCREAESRYFPGTDVTRLKEVSGQHGVNWGLGILKASVRWVFLGTKARRDG